MWKAQGLQGELLLEAILMLERARVLESDLCSNLSPVADWLPQSGKGSSLL